MSNTLNLVYDNWDDNKNLPYQTNAKELYFGEFIYPIDFVIKGFNIQNDLIEKYKLSDVKNHRNKSFFYIVTVMPNVIGNKIKNNEIPIPIEVIKELKINKNLNILFMNTQEIEEFETIELLHIWTKSFNINQKQIWLSNCNFKLYDYKKILNTDINFNIQRQCSVDGIIQMDYSFLKMKFKPKKEGSLFMCHNKRGRLHRYALLCLLKKYDILADVDWSLLTDSYLDKYLDVDNRYSHYGRILTKNDIDYLEHEITYFNNIKMKKTKYEQKYKHDIEFDKEIFQNSYFNIVTETIFETKSIHISEKSLRPFYAMQFPLILASYNHIKEIKKVYDFDWFDDVIDHSYDDEPNNRQRLFRFANEIKKIHQNKEFFINFYKNNKDRFIANNKKALKLINTVKKEDFEFVKNLMNYSIYKNI